MFFKCDFSSHFCFFRICKIVRNFCPKFSKSDRNFIRRNFLRLMYYKVWKSVGNVVVILRFYIKFNFQISLANLNSMLCPAISDPFYGPHYRWFAIIHQQFFILTIGKVYTLVVYTALKVKDLRKKEREESNNNCYVSTFLEENKSK